MILIMRRSRTILTIFSDRVIVMIITKLLIPLHCHIAFDVVILLVSLQLIIICQRAC